MPAGNKSSRTIKIKPILIDQNEILINFTFHCSALNNNWQQNNTAANARFPYTPINAACPWFTVK